jgi:hypothetical protein
VVVAGRRGNPDAADLTAHELRRYLVGETRDLKKPLVVVLPARPVEEAERPPCLAVERDGHGRHNRQALRLQSIAKPRRDRHLRVGEEIRRPDGVTLPHRAACHTETSGQGLAAPPVPVADARGGNTGEPAPRSVQPEERGAPNTDRPARAFDRIPRGPSDRAVVKG